MTRLAILMEAPLRTMAHVYLRRVCAEAGAWQMRTEMVFVTMWTIVLVPLTNAHLQWPWSGVGMRLRCPARRGLRLRWGSIGCGGRVWRRLHGRCGRRCVCDDVDECIGIVDECGVCNGPGVIYDCGCTDIPEGDCDCAGNVLDVLGHSGIQTDENANGIYDVDEVLGAQTTTPATSTSVQRGRCVLRNCSCSPSARRHTVSGKATGVMPTQCIDSTSDFGRQRPTERRVWVRLVPVHGGGS